MLQSSTSAIIVLQERAGETKMEMDDKVDDSDQGSSVEPMDLIPATVDLLSGKNAIDMVAEGTRVGGDVGPLDSTLEDEDGDITRVDTTHGPDKAQVSLVISSRETSASSTSTLAANMDFGEHGFAVVVPPVSRRWKYKTYDVDPRVRSVIEEVKNGERLRYKVNTRDGRTSLVSASGIKFASKRVMCVMRSLPLALNLIVPDVAPYLYL